MSEDAQSLQAIRRILVALDASDPSLAALDAAAALAAQLGAELEALFVEDIDLLRLAELPFARVTSLLRQEARPTDREHMERLLRRRAARAEEALRRRAQRLHLRATFHSVRGEVSAEVLAAAGRADLVGLGRAGYAPPAGLGSTARAALAAGRPLLVTGGQLRAGHGLLAVYDGSPAAGRALQLAADLTEATGQPLSVLLLAPSPAAAQQLAGDAAAWLDGRGLTADLLHAWAEPLPAILAAARRQRPALLLLGLAEGGYAERVLEEASWPLLLVP